MKGMDVVLSVMDNYKRPIDGRTAIQKIVYLASVKIGIDLEYMPHYYGPYSPLVAGLVENLTLMGYISEQRRLTAYDREMYSYSLTSDGIKLTRKIKRREQKNHLKIKEVVDECQKIAGNNINVLSWAAKVYFLLTRKGKKASYRDISRTGRPLGWKLSKNEIVSGAELLVSLGFVKKQDAI